MHTNSNVLEVNLTKIKNNIKIIKEHIKTKFFAVVKANGYGLGGNVISKYIEEDVDMFCVSCVAEAIDLRMYGITKDILVFGYISQDDFYLLEKYNIIATIYSFDLAKKIEKSGYKIRAHIKVETGHNRLGFQYNDLCIEQIKNISKIENIIVEGIYSHFSTADEDDDLYVKKQNEIFNKFLDGLKSESKNWVKHISNSAATLYYNYKYDAVRVGISLYGIYPNSELRNIFLEDCFSLKSNISLIKEINPGESVSYGRRFIANKNLKIATVSIGYADGYKRNITGKGCVLIGGKRCKILGSITMDQLIVDVSGIDCAIDDEVILIGRQKEERITVEEVADWADTISYEIITSISNRVERKYIY